MSLSSGSSGNCYYLGTDEHAILIDAGIPVKQIKGYLKDAGIPFEKIMAVFVTHDHADHIKALGNLGEKCAIPVYATRETHEGINNNTFYANPYYLGVFSLILFCVGMRLCFADLCGESQRKRYEETDYCH